MVWKIWRGGQCPGCPSPVCGSDMYKRKGILLSTHKRDEASETPFENIAKLCNKPLKM